MYEDTGHGTLQQAGEMLRRLAAQVEDGTMTADDEAGGSIAAAWRGAAEALVQASRPSL